MDEIKTETAEQPDERKQEMLARLAELKQKMAEIVPHMNRHQRRAAEAQARKIQKLRGKR